MASSHRPFGLGTYSLAGCPPFAGVVLDGEQVLAVSALEPLGRRLGLPSLHRASVLELVEHWDLAFDALQAAVDALADAHNPLSKAILALCVPMASVRVHPPLQSRQLLLSGANYFKHVVDIIVDMGPGKSPGTEHMTRDQLRRFAEDLMRKRKQDGVPYIFSKPVSVLSGAYDPIVLPPDVTQPDWELELAVVMGRSARLVSQEEASGCIAGYLIANDITNRDRIWAKDDNKAFGTDWISAKCSPSYLPVGPYFVPASHVANPAGLTLELKLNGETKQRDTTADMIFDVPRLIEFVSSRVQLWPGDLICTGSPAGNGTHYNRFLQPGDVVECTITGLGNQRTPVVAQRS